MNFYLHFSELTLASISEDSFSFLSLTCHMAAFGVIVAGRMVQTDFTMLKDGEYVIELPNADSINHIVVFLTGLQPLPDGFGASFFVSWPTAEGSGMDAANWTNLGFISNEKPSAVFRIGQLNKSAQNQLAIFSGVQMASSNSGPKSAVLGIMLEQLEQIRSRGAAGDEQQQNTAVEFAQKLLRNFVNFVQSFVVTLPKPADGQQMGMTATTATTTMEEYVPAKAVTDWFQQFQRRLQMNPNFWRALP